MRPLTEPETKTLFEKLATYCGKGISNLIADPTGGNDRNVFRVQVRTASNSSSLSHHHAHANR
ncbi:60S ribosome subunit biogenesis protein NIP7 [Alternaria alternata]|nr:60S ribosome subunit biogenesis protein NIP7 [Alternaria alternata]